jgi:hypothetical protein
VKALLLKGTPGHPFVRSSDVLASQCTTETAMSDVLMRIRLIVCCTVHGLLCSSANEAALLLLQLLLLCGLPVSSHSLCRQVPTTEQLAAATESPPCVANELLPCVAISHTVSSI